MHKRILIVGANGFIGQAHLQHLHAAGHQVTACVRNTRRYCPAHHTINVIAADYTTHTRTAQWLPLVQGFDVVINAVGIIREQGTNTFEQIHTRGPIAMFDAAVAAGVKQIIQISALGSDASAQTLFHLSKRDADDHLAAMECYWLILRPSLIYGSGCKSATLFKAVAAVPLIPVAGSGDQPVQPIAWPPVTPHCIRPPRSAAGKGELSGRQHRYLNDEVAHATGWQRHGPAGDAEAVDAASPHARVPLPWSDAFGSLPLSFACPMGFSGTVRRSCAPALQPGQPGRPAARRLGPREDPSR